MKATAAPAQTYTVTLARVEGSTVAAYVHKDGTATQYAVRLAPQGQCTCSCPHSVYRWPLVCKHLEAAVAGLKAKFRAAVEADIAELSAKSAAAVEAASLAASMADAWVAIAREAARTAAVRRAGKAA